MIIVACHHNHHRCLCNTQCVLCPPKSGMGFTKLAFADPPPQFSYLLNSFFLRKDCCNKPDCLGCDQDDQMVVIIMVVAVVLVVFMIELCNMMMIDTDTSDIKGGDHITGNRLQGAAGGRGTVFHLPI